MTTAMTDPISWEDAQTFLAVVEHQSFSAAAKALQLGQPTISRRIRDLENQLENQLFIRGKHGAEPTESAMRLIPAAEQMAKWAAEFDRSARGYETSLSGKVTIAAPPGVAVERLAPFAAKLKGQHPSLALEILSAIDHVDLTRGGADIAVRTQHPNEPELIAIYQFESDIRVYASRSYATKIVQPCTWKDLDWVTWAGRYQNVAPRPMLERLIPDFSPIFSSDDYLVQKSAVVSGLGAMLMERIMDNTADDLVEIDIGVTLPPSKFYLVCAKSMQQVPRVRLVMDMLAESY